MSVKNLLKEFMNDPREVHAFMHGVYDGFLESKGLSEVTKNLEDVKRELHYAKFGYAVGFLLKAFLIYKIGRAIA
mgnify:CR=1 FL=1